MPQYVSWDSPPHRAKGSEFFKLLTGRSYRLRILTSPLEYYQRWSPVACRVEPNADPFAGQGDKPKLRLSTYVLDHADKALKIVDLPISVRNAIAEWRAATGQDPCGPMGTDFSIRVTGHGLNTRYSAVAVPPLPLDGIAMPSRGELEARLVEARRPHTPEEIHEKVAKVMVA